MKCFYDVEISTKKEVENSQLVKIQLEGNSNRVNAEKEIRDVLDKHYPNSYRIFNRSSPIPAIILMAIAVFLTFFTYDLKTGTTQLKLFPSIESFVCSLVLYSAIVLRVKGLQDSFNSLIDVIVSVLAILLLATFIKVLVNDAVESSGKVNEILQKIGLDNSWWLIGFAIVLSWLGKKNIAKYVYLIVAFLGLIELCSIDGFMGSFLSIIFALCSFLGFAFYLKYEGKIVTDSFKETLSSITTKTGILQIMGDGKRLGNYITLYIEKKKLPSPISIDEPKAKEKKSKTQKTR